MLPLPHPCRPALLALVLLALSGCEQLFDKGMKADIALAEKKAAAGDFRAAVKYYEASLDGTEKSAATHYKLGLLYSNKMESPLDSIHHFNRYLALAPGGPHAKDVENVRKADESRLRSKLSNEAPVTQGEAVGLRNETLKLRKEKQELHTTIAGLRAQLASAPKEKGKEQFMKKPIAPGARTHTVKSGDTFAKISRQYYKTSSRAQAIQDANFSNATGTVKIKPGMVLMIPK